MYTGSLLLGRGFSFQVRERKLILFHFSSCCRASIFTRSHMPVILLLFLRLPFPSIREHIYLQSRARRHNFQTVVGAYPFHDRFLHFILLLFYSLSVLLPPQFNRFFYYHKFSFSDLFVCDPRCNQTKPLVKSPVHFDCISLFKYLRILVE